MCGTNSRLEPPASAREAMCTQVSTYNNHFASAIGPVAHAYTMAWEPNQRSLSGLKHTSYRESHEQVPDRHITLENAQMYASRQQPLVESAERVAPVQTGSEWQHFDTRARLNAQNDNHINRQPRPMSADQYESLRRPQPQYVDEPHLHGKPARPTDSAYGYNRPYEQRYEQDHTVARHYSADAGSHRQINQRAGQFWADTPEPVVRARNSEVERDVEGRTHQQRCLGPCCQTPRSSYAYEQELQRKPSKEHLAMYMHNDRWVEHSRRVDNAHLSPSFKNEATYNHHHGRYDCEPYSCSQDGPQRIEYPARYAEVNNPRGRLQVDRVDRSFVSSPNSENHSLVPPSRLSSLSPGVETARSHSEASQPAPRPAFPSTPPSSTHSPANTNPVRQNLDRLRKLAQAEGTSQLVVVQEPCRVQLRSKPSKSYMVRPPPKVAVMGGYDINTDYIEAVLVQGEDCKVVKFEDQPSVVDGNVVQLNHQRNFHKGIVAFTELRIMVKPSSFEHNGSLRLKFRLCRRGSNGIGDTRTAEVLSSVPIHLYSNYTQMSKEQRADYMASNPKRRQPSSADVDRTSDSNTHAAGTADESSTASPRSSNFSRSPAAPEREISRSRKNTPPHMHHANESAAGQGTGAGTVHSGYAGMPGDYEYGRQYREGERKRTASASFMDANVAVDVVVQEASKRQCTRMMPDMNACTGMDMPRSRCNSF